MHSDDKFWLAMWGSMFTTVVLLGTLIMINNRYDQANQLENAKLGLCPIYIPVPGDDFSHRVFEKCK